MFAKLLEFHTGSATSPLRPRVAVHPRVASSEAGHDRTRLGVGIIGAGAISAAHAAGYRNAGSRVSLVAVADPKLDRALDLQRKFSIDEAFCDYHELLARSDVDVVSVCTPASAHAEV